MSRDTFSFDPQQPETTSREREHKDSLPAERTTLERPELSLIEGREPVSLKPERDDSPRAYT
jgi:hypothetical protein